MADSFTLGFAVFMLPYAAAGAAAGLLLRLPFTRPLAVAGLAAVLWFLFSN